MLISHTHTVRKVLWAPVGRRRGLQSPEDERPCHYRRHAIVWPEQTGTGGRHAPSGGTDRAWPSCTRRGLYVGVRPRLLVVYTSGSTRRGLLVGVYTSGSGPRYAPMTLQRSEMTRRTRDSLRAESRPSHRQRRPPTPPHKYGGEVAPAARPTTHLFKWSL